MLALFDLDDTLVDRSAGLKDWARGFTYSRRLPRDAESVICARLRERACFADFVDLQELLGLREDPGDLWHEYVDGLARSIRCFPGAREGLDALRSAGWSLGVATNGAADIQRAKLEATGLALLFDGICISEAVRARKPERRHFEAAASECGVLPSAGGWMVGDNPATDIGGAAAAGLRTIWVSGVREWPDGLRKPDAAVQHVAEAIELLRGLTV
ncbi:HAD family hydrolase [Streptomyces sp. LN245]|uniref:HAD family hydrolase n=1 Tax=Streptomyces sp. LN245 TaxID=3112975 RepID=UPI0037124E6D